MNRSVILIGTIPCCGLKSDDPGTDCYLPLGRAAVMRDGSDVALITYGRTVLNPLKVAEALAGEGVSVEVVDLRTIALRVTGEEGEAYKIGDVIGAIGSAGSPEGPVSPATVTRDQPIFGMRILLTKT